MKKIILSLILILMLNTVIAQNLDINLIEYHPDNYYSRIQIKNTGDKDLTKITINIDNTREISVVDLLKKGSIVNAITSVMPGNHEVKVNSVEGISESKILYFSPSKEQIIEIKEQEQKTEVKSQENLAQLQEEIQKEREKAIALGLIKEKGEVNWLLIGVITLIIGILVLFWIIYKNKNAK